MVPVRGFRDTPAGRAAGEAYQRRVIDEARRRRIRLELLGLTEADVRRFMRKTSEELERLYEEARGGTGGEAPF